MEPIAKLEWQDGVLKASSPNLPPLAWTRPADLAEARLEIEPPVESLSLEDGGDLLTAAFAVVPFVREPLPRPSFGSGVTLAAREAFLLFTGQNAASQRADAFRVMRGEPDDFVVCARRYKDVWKAAAFSVKPTSLTFRFEDLHLLLPKTAPRYEEYIVEVVRDPNSKDSPEAQAAGIVRETIAGASPDARIRLELPRGGGFTLTFWPVAAVHS
jgi:hypothetical protein